jgi:chemotaxis protein CheC
MLLSETQIDALKELINIAFARTGAALSQLTNQRVLLDVPDVAVYPVNAIPDRLTAFRAAELATIHQLFSGPAAGDAMLLLRADDAARLIGLLTDEPSLRPDLDASGREVLIEVGNILLNACMGVFGNVLQMHFTFSVPHLRRDSLDELFHSDVTDNKGFSHALVTCTQFHLRDTAVEGSLVIVLGVTSLEQVIAAVAEWAARAAPVATQAIPNLNGQNAAFGDADLTGQQGGTP